MIALKFFPSQKNFALSDGWATKGKSWRLGTCHSVKGPGVALEAGKHQACSESSAKDVLNASENITADEGSKSGISRDVPVSGNFLRPIRHDIVRNRQREHGMAGSWCGLKQVAGQGED